MRGSFGGELFTTFPCSPAGHAGQEGHASKEAHPILLVIISSYQAEPA